MKGMILKARAKQKRNKPPVAELETRVKQTQSNAVDSDDEEEVSKGMLASVFKNRYFVLKYLGSGAYSRIWLVYDIFEDRYAAMKVQFPDDYEEAQHEYQIMKALGENKYLMKLYDTFDQEYNGEKYFCFILELLGGDLYSATEKREPIPIQHVIGATREILCGLEAIHSRGYIHTDLKPENILLLNPSEKIQDLLNWFNLQQPREMFSEFKKRTLPPDATGKNAKIKARNKAVKLFRDAMFDRVIEKVASTWDSDSDASDDSSDEDESAQVSETKRLAPKDGQFVKIGDFGLVEKIKDNPEDIQTLQFRAPEVILVFDRINEKVDIWSLGCIVYEMLTCRTLFRITEDDETLQTFQHLYLIQKQIAKLPVDFIDEGNVSSEFFTENNRPKFKNRHYRELMANTERKNIRETLRDNIRTRTDSKTFDLLVDFLEKCFRFYPKQRPSVRELLKHPLFSST